MMNNTITETILGCRRTALFALAAILAQAAPGKSMPPHPDLVDRIENGSVEKPYYLRNKEALETAGVDAGGEPLLRKGAAFGKPAFSGNFKILTLLVDFSDNAASVNAADFDNLVYSSAPGSVNDFYMENSYGNLSITTPVYPSALGWFRAPQTYAYYVNNQNGLGAYPHNAQRLVEDLVDLVDPFVDFSQFDSDGDSLVDGLIVAHAGPGAELTGYNGDIWSHKWSISPRLKDGVYIYTYSINPEYWITPGDITIGVYAHELGHVFGLPDLYDIDYSSKGVGKWSLMASGSWNGSLGSSPSHFDAWSRIFMGFVTPNVLAVDQNGVSIPQVESNPTIYKLWTNGSPANEYFLVENRQRTGYDTYIPSSGLLIWHIDDDQATNENEWWPGSGLPGHYKVALVQADDLWELEQDSSYGDTGDPYPGVTVNWTFSSSSSPNSDSYAGTGTLVSVVNISNSGVTMTADMAVGSPQGIGDDGAITPENVWLSGNFPNPFNPLTMIELEVTLEVPVKIEVYDLNGRLVRTLIDDVMEPGSYNIEWNGEDSKGNQASSGVYFCRLAVPGKSGTIKMTKIK